MHHMPFCRVQLRQMNHQFVSWADGARCILDFKTFLPCPGNSGSVGRFRGVIHDRFANDVLGSWFCRCHFPSPNLLIVSHLWNKTWWLIVASVFLLNQKRWQTFVRFSLSGTEHGTTKKHENCNVTQPTADLQTSISGSQMVEYVLQSLSLPAAYFGSSWSSPLPPVSE